MTFCDADGDRLNLNWNEGKLNCDNWNRDDKAYDNIGVLALMMGKINKKTSRSFFEMSFFVLLLQLFGNVLNPSAEPSSDCSEFFRNLAVFSGVYAFHFP